MTGHLNSMTRLRRASRLMPAPDAPPASRDLLMATARTRPGFDLPERAWCAAGQRSTAPNLSNCVHSLSLSVNKRHSAPTSTYCALTSGKLSACAAQGCCQDGIAYVSNLAREAHHDRCHCFGGQLRAPVRRASMVNPGVPANGHATAHQVCTCNQQQLYIGRRSCSQQHAAIRRDGTLTMICMVLKRTKRSKA